MKNNIHIFSHPDKHTTAQSFRYLENKDYLVKFYDYKKNVNYKKNDIILHIDPCNFICFDPIKTTQIKGIYLIDTHRDFNSRLQISKMFDFVFVAQYLDAQRLKKCNKNTFWLPLAYDSNIKLKKKYKKIYQVGFVGNLSIKDEKSKYRTDIISSVLEKYTSNLQRFVDTNQCYKIYKQSLFVINKSIDGDLNMRVFEAMGNGAILITDKIPNKLELLFKKNFHYLEYKTKKQCLGILKKFFNNQNKKNINRISSRAMKLIHKKHTYQHRLNFIIKKMKKIRKKHNIFSDKVKLNSLFFFHYFYTDIIFFFKYFIKNKNINLVFIFYLSLTFAKIIYRRFRYEK